MSPMTLKSQLIQLVEQALTRTQEEGRLPSIEVVDVAIERPRNSDHGDFACSLPLKLVGKMKMSPESISDELVSAIPPSPLLDRIWTAPPGFVNFRLNPGWLVAQVDAIRKAGSAYGDLQLGAGRKVQVEFVSINPTGPLHVGHARGAVIGSALANVLSAAGFQVVREYYFNDSGNQMNRFYQSLFARYAQLLGEEYSLPPDGYAGRYMVDLAGSFVKSHGDTFLRMPKEQGTRDLGKLGIASMMKEIGEDVRLLRVDFDVWFSEASLFQNGQYERVMNLLRERGLLVEREGAIWFASTALGKEQDKVLVRSTGVPTYFATDAAYHYNKLIEREFDLIINVLGADHLGHVSQMKSLVEALGRSSSQVTTIVHQMVTLKRGSEAVKASKRTGAVVTLRELVNEVGADACRFVFLSRSPNSQMEFDVELAKQESVENPVYYVQYAHARIAGILRRAAREGIDFSDGDTSLLAQESELALIRKMIELPELVEKMACSLTPHHLPHFALEMATVFQQLYERCQVISRVAEDNEITKARLKLVDAARVVLARCLSLMVMDAPERM